MNAPSAPSAPAPAALVKAIEGYLAAHPLAADSLDGVARWWLGSRGIHATVQEVEQALNALVAGRRLRQTRLADGTVLYSHMPSPGGA